MTLEERIKALMEGKSVTSTEDLTEAKVKVSKDGEVDFDSGSDKEDADKDEDQDDSQDDSEDQDDSDKDEEGSDEDTDFAKQTKKNTAVVKEDASNEKLKVGEGKKEAGGKLAAPPSSGDKQDDAGKNAKLKVGQGKKDETGPKKFAAAPNADQSRNSVDDQSLPSKPNKITVGESVAALFDGEELSEEFMSKAETIFESAVSVLVEQRTAELEEEFQAKLEVMTEEVEAKVEEAVEAVQDELIENIDGFLNKVVEQWISDNQVALESGIKVEMVTNFIDGLKTLFQENYIEVPEDKLDVVEEQAKRIAELEEALVVINDNNDILAEENDGLKKSVIVENAGKGLTLKQKEKFVSLCEGLEYTSDEEYETKVQTIKESYFKNGDEVKSSFEAAADETQVGDTSPMNKYVDILGGTLRFQK